MTNTFKTVGFTLLILVVFNTFGQTSNVQKESIEFQSTREVTLRGDLWIPNNTSKKMPLIIAVHGSGKTDRNDSFILEMVKHYTANGIAVLTYDKRGVGKSDGDYIGSYSSSMITYAIDVIAAFDKIKRDDRFDSKKIGVSGISQAGFIIPIVVSILKKELAFSIIYSGPTVSIYEENIYSNLTGDASGIPTKNSTELIETEMSKLNSAGYDPYPFIEEMTIPSLWVFGTLDKNIPVYQSVIDLKAIKKRWNRDFEWKLFENANHSLKKCKTGGSWEKPVPNVTHELVFPYVINWINNH
ncbi:CocE/NonD family hydrolase [uncultured Psychroserpens sp.]|uniref:alpha/beta hydrolase family protein n=1 Tax=uncultured Psychroserpens sp. TaxID=255436 RepID=UPI00261BB838|nr:CocE/NonD family hydrolase [uncultured Psychroserpens sp.]